MRFRSLLLIAATVLPQLAANLAFATILPLPTNVPSGSVVQLQCGRTYSGTLDLTGKSDVVVKTAGRCGKASLSPAQPISKWRKWRDNIYVAAIDFSPVQVLINETPLHLAHYPNRPQVWAKGKGVSANRLQYRLPSQDVTGAVLVFRANDWMIEERRIVSHANDVTVIEEGTKDNFDFNPTTEFYVEGKLWMLDSPGEWAFSNGRLYVWAPDGKSPEGRVLASPSDTAINATGSSNVTIEGVRVLGGRHGIVGLNSRNLHIRNAEILHSLEDGIHAGGDGLLVEQATIAHAGKNGVWAYYGSTRSTIRHSTIVATGMTAKPKRSKGGIVFELGSGQQIHHNRVLNSAYIGIRVHRDAAVTHNEIDRACQILTDCGGIYTFARDKLPLNVRIEGNVIKNLSHRWAYAIYLDDYANGVTVTRNVISNNPSGLQIHNGFNNEVAKNVFSGSQYQHVLMNETAGSPSVQRNRFVGNVFLSAKEVPIYRLWSGFDGAYVKRFADFDGNIYAAASAAFAEVAGNGMLNYTRWKEVMKQDGASTLRAAVQAPSETALKAMLDNFSQMRAADIAK